jgi:hypothetical protein
VVARLKDFGEVVAFYSSRDEAEAALEDVLRDEPGWEGELEVVAIALPFSTQ